jgi:cyanophycin synthetase
LIGEQAVARGIGVAFGKHGLVVMRHGRRKRRFRQGKTWLNAPLVQQAVTQKEIASRLLRQREVPAPDNAVFIDAARARSWAESALPVVVKPNAASKGKLVQVGIRDRDTFDAAFRRVYEEFGQVLVEEQSAGVEHRFAFVNGEVPAVARRVPMHVVGDGQHTVAELIELKNDERAKSGNPIHKRLSVDAEVRRVLADDGWTLDAVPGADTTVWLRRTSNISTGGDAAILEINGSPMFSMHHFPWVGTPRNVIGGVLDVMFPATAR